MCVCVCFFFLGGGGKWGGGESLRNLSKSILEIADGRRQKLFAGEGYRGCLHPCPLPPINILIVHQASVKILQNLICRAMTFASGNPCKLFLPFCWPVLTFLKRLQTLTVTNRRIRTLNFEYFSNPSAIYISFENI